MRKWRRYCGSARTRAVVGAEALPGELIVRTEATKEDGAEVWARAIGKVGRNRGPQYPGTRSTPTVDGDRVYVLGGFGDLVCLETKGGKEVCRITDLDHDGKPDSVTVFASNLRLPTSIAFYQDWVYVGETNAVSRFSAPNTRASRTRLTNGAAKRTQKWSEPAIRRSGSRMTDPGSSPASSTSIVP